VHITNLQIFNVSYVCIFVGFLLILNLSPSDCWHWLRSKIKKWNKCREIDMEKTCEQTCW